MSTVVARVLQVLWFRHALLRLFQEQGVIYMAALDTPHL